MGGIKRCLYIGVVLAIVIVMITSTGCVIQSIFDSMNPLGGSKQEEDQESGEHDDKSIIVVGLESLGDDKSTESKRPTPTGTPTPQNDTGSDTTPGAGGADEGEQPDTNPPPTIVVKGGTPIPDPPTEPPPEEPGGGIVDENANTDVTVNVSAILDEIGTTAYVTVPEGRVLSLIGRVVNTAAEKGVLSMVRLQVDVPSGATEFVLPLTAEIVNDMSEKGVDLLYIGSGIGSITTDRATIELINETREGGDVEITLRNVDSPRSEQVETKPDVTYENPAIDITIKAGDSYISELGGQMTVELPYKAKQGQLIAGIYVYYLTNDGEETTVASRYIREQHIVSFDATHLSTYAIGYHAEDEEPPVKEIGGEWITLFIIATVPALVFAELLFIRALRSKRKFR